jgi:EAL domain-containing protein (putative c-di-GMP-specific phosphodiesterase class I)
VEALIRWNHPKKGFMPPDLFIPLAEQTGDIRKLTFWVLNEAIRQCSEWRNKGVELNVAINLSARDLLNRDLAVIIARLLQQYKVDAGWLVLEITESAIMQDAERALDMLLVLSGMGLSLSIDDFGTGYSSMEYLKKLPVSELKIDRSFVKNLANDQEDQIIVRSAIDLGHNLGMTIVAEGVEDEKSLAVLKAHHCDLAQGYLFSPPLSVEKLISWIETSPWGS